jgi:hypothetical protein
MAHVAVTAGVASAEMTVLWSAVMTDALVLMGLRLGAAVFAMRLVIYRLTALGVRCSRRVLLSVVLPVA